MKEENNSKKAQIGKNIAGQAIKKILKKSMTPLMIGLGIALVIIIIFSVGTWFLKKLDTKEDPNDPKNAPAAVRNFLNDTTIDENGKITSAKSINEFWDELRRGGNKITKYLNSAEELSKLIYAARALDYPDTRPNPDLPIDWDKIDLDSKEVQGIIKFKRALANGETITMSYVSPTKFQELISEYKDSGSEKDKNEVLKHFTMEKTASSSNNVSTGGSSIVEEALKYACSWVGKVPYKSVVSGDADNTERFLPLKEGRASDCSHFIHWVFAHVGLMEGTQDYFNKYGHSLTWGLGGDAGGCPGTVKIGTNLSQASPGDVLWWHFGDGPNNHVAIYLGNEKMVECAGGHGVIISKVTQNSGFDQILHFSQLPTDPTGYFDPDTMTLHSSLNYSNADIAKVSSLQGMVFMGDSILSMVSIKSSGALEKEGAKTMYRGGTTAHYFLGTETSNALTNNCIEKNGYFDWDENFKDVTNPAGFYLMLGQNFHRADDRIRQMDELIKKIRSKYPNPPIYISSVLRLLDGSNTESIKQSTNRMNEELKNYCAENRNNNIYYSDVLREYDEGDESLHKHTYDDDHPNEEGARIIIKNIKENIIGTSTNTTGTNYTANSGQTSTTGTGSYSGKVTGQMIVDEAEKYVGKLPYVYGGQSLTTGADCSGFAWAILKKLGLIDWGRTNDAGFQDKGTAVSDISQAQPGDILRFNGHIAIYKGNGYMVEALNPGKGITNTRKVTDESRPVIAIRRFTDDAGSASGTGITASTPEEIASIPRSYNNDVFNVDENNWIDPMVKMDPPYSADESREYRAIQACCYDGKYAIAGQNKNYGGIDASSNGGRIIWLNMETGELEHEVITSKGGHMDGIAYDSDRNMVLHKVNDSTLEQIDNNTKTIVGEVKLSEGTSEITYLATTKQLVGVDTHEFKFYKYDSSKNEYVKESSVKVDRFPINHLYQGAGNDGQCIYVFDSRVGDDDGNNRVWVYSLDGQLREEHPLGSGFPRAKEIESGFADNNGNLWIGTNHSLVKVINYKANPANVNPGSSSGTKMYNTTYQVKVATWSENLDKVESNDPSVSSYDTGLVHNMTTTTIPYQAIVSKYKMPFNYLWTMLVYSNDKKYTFDLADLVKNSKIEITVHDNLNKNKTVVTDTYTDYTEIHAEADVNIEYEEKNTSTISTTNPTNNQPATYTTTTTTTKNTSEHGKADGHTSVNYKVVHTTINNTNTLDIALTLADSWYTKYEKKYTYNGENTNESNSSSSLDNIVHDPVTKNGELGGIKGDVDSNAIAQAYNNITNIHNAHVTGRSGEVATLQTTRQNRKKNIYTQTTTSSYSSSPGKNVDRSAIAIAETPKTGELNTNSFAKLPEDRLDISGIQQGFCLIDDEMYVTVMGNEDETCKLYLIDMTNFTQCDVISGLIGHGNTVTYDSVTGDVIFPEEHDTKLIHIDKASKKFENPRTVNTPADNSAYVAYNKQNDLFINQSDYKVYTREAFYSNGSSNVKFQYSKPDSELHLQGGGTYGNQVYVCYSHHGEGRYDDGNCIVVCNIHTGRQEKVIYDSTPRELEEVDFDKDGTMYAIYGGGGICVYKTDYNYYADNDIDKSNITPGMVTNQIARYNTGGEYDYDKSSFEKVFNAHYNARSNILSAAEWLFEALEQNEDTSKMVDLTKYLLYKATGHDYGVTTFDFETYDPEGFNPVSTGIYGNTPQEKVWFALRNAGFSEYAVAGAMGNIESESGGFNANAIEKGSGNGFGLCQWSFERRTRLEEYAKSKGKSPSDIEVQIEYLIGELTPGGGADGYAKFNFSSNYENWKNATSVEQATELYCRYFERPNMQYAHMDRRKEAARKYYNEFHGKTAPTGSVGGGDILKACEETMQNYLSRGVHYSTNGGKLISGDIERCYNESNYICCATYVSSVLYKSGLLTPSQINKYAYHWTGDGGVPDMLKAAGWRQVSMDEIQPGDVVNNFKIHVLIYAGGDLYYDQGTCTVSSSGKAPTRSVKSGFNSSYRNSSYQVWRAPGK